MTEKTFSYINQLFESGYFALFDHETDLKTFFRKQLFEIYWGDDNMQEFYAQVLE